MSHLIDTSAFPTGANIDYESEEAVELLKTLTDDAWSFVRSYRWTPPIADLILAFGIAPMIGLYLMRFAPGDSYPIPVAPTTEHAEMLLSRIVNIRKNYIPLAYERRLVTAGLPAPPRRSRTC